MKSNYIKKRKTVGLPLLFTPSCHSEMKPKRFFTAFRMTSVGFRQSPLHYSLLLLTSKKDTRRCLILFVLINSYIVYDELCCVTGLHTDFACTVAVCISNTVCTCNFA